MYSRLTKLLLASLTTGAVFATSAVAAAPSGPPPPTATGGQTVTLVAAGLSTPTSFAFGGGSVFEGDGGTESSGPPNGGVFVLKGGTATKLPGSPQFVAGLAWHQGALYVSGGFITPHGAQFKLLKWSGWNGTAFTSRRRSTPRPRSSPASTASPSAPTAGCTSASTSA